ncbi:DUF2179 domain-containing protein [Aerococcus kribbianus]|uniref:UPF0316 protein OW157_06265 n=1 Tax=Aerococcus kribbianus TaxID=2999064 RepID=A0A9X3JH18_9LACT|nr:MULTISPECIES: DUF2179 domain-containing protein [unclassified Aerococcus]MCZ0717877.1 DUF2179 domain-containing protein [Aerococcus sp. YH-aer221]MCZ0726164.1 DUF2179 domain-containing protein [Aerococcus sp. YH-aer222]
MDWLLLFKIFGINLVYIMLNTIRTLLVMKGYRRVAPFIAVVEVIIYTLGLSIVIQYLSNPVYLVAYATGFGVGIYLGILIEDRLALGYSVIQIFSQSADHTLPNALRERGYGVTIQPGYGRDGDRLVLTVLTPRANELTLRNTIDEIDEKAFYISYDARYIHGGFWSKRVNKPLIKRAAKKDKAQEEIVVEEIPDKKTYIED